MDVPAFPRKRKGSLVWMSMYLQQGLIAVLVWTKHEPGAFTNLRVCEAGQNFFWVLWKKSLYPRCLYLSVYSPGVLLGAVMYGVMLIWNLVDTTVQLHLPLISPGCRQAFLSLWLCAPWWPDCVREQIHWGLITSVTHNLLICWAKSLWDSNGDKRRDASPVFPCTRSSLQKEQVGPALFEYASALFKVRCKPISQNLQI